MKAKTPNKGKALVECSDWAGKKARPSARVEKERPGEKKGGKGTGKIAGAEKGTVTKSQRPWFQKKKKKKKKKKRGPTQNAKTLGFLLAPKNSPEKKKKKAPCSCTLPKGGWRQERRMHSGGLKKKGEFRTPAAKGAFFFSQCKKGRGKRCIRPMRWPAAWNWRFHWMGREKGDSII